MVHSTVKPFLAIEWQQKGEGEATAALRLLQRLPILYGSRFFDIHCWMHFTPKPQCWSAFNRSAGMRSLASNKTSANCINRR